MELRRRDGRHGLDAEPRRHERGARAVEKASRPVSAVRTAVRRRSAQQRRDDDVDIRLGGRVDDDDSSWCRAALERQELRQHGVGPALADGPQGDALHGVGGDGAGRLLGDVVAQVGARVDITNTGTRPITYTFSQQDYGGLAAVHTAPPARIAYTSELLANPLKLSPRISFPGAGFTVNPGQTRTAQFNFSPLAEGAAAAPEALPVYSGRIVIKGSNGDELCVPYLGLAADLKRDVGVMFERTAGVPLIVSGAANVSIETKANFTFSQDAARPDFPRLSMRSLFGTRELRWDIFEASWRERQWAYPPRQGQAGFVGSVAAWSFIGGDLMFTPDSDAAWEIFRFPLINVPRTMSNILPSEFSWFGELGNGTQIAPGRYRMRVASLRPFGNRAAADNWDVFETPEIEVLPLRK
ncbi:hypothetical protein HYQ44_000652 [Verticillium longisporum]|nr:hypothetical protein HYQ44_000652 [Verticillium longisporum]